MIPVQPGHSLWTWPYSNSCGWLCSWCCSDSTLLLSWGATNTENVAASTKFPPCVRDWRRIPDSWGSSGSLSESLKYLGYRPQAVLLNHNIGSPDIRLHGNSQSIGTESAVHIECQRATMIIQFLNYWCQADMKGEKRATTSANKQKIMILLPYLSYSVNICASVAPEI